MARSFHGRPQTPRGSGRMNEWFIGPSTAGASNSILSFTQPGKTLWTTGAQALDALTIVRIRGELTAWLEVVGTIGDGFARVGAGIGIVTVDAFDIGPTAMPGPVTDPDWSGWMWVEYVGAMVGASVTEEFKGLAQHRFVIDTKAMRKIRPNEVVFGMFETISEVGAATLSFASNTRMLAKT